MLRSLQLSTWNIVKSQEYFARPKYYASPEKIHQPSGISIYWWHLEPVVSGLSVSWAMWHEADGWEIWKHGRDQWRHRCQAAGDQNLVTAPTAETRKHETGCLHCRRGCLNISQYCHQHLLQTGKTIWFQKFCIKENGRKTFIRNLMFTLVLVWVLVVILFRET